MIRHHDEHNQVVAQRDRAVGGEDARKAIMPGREHLPPYLDPAADQTVVKRVTLDFLNGYLKHPLSALSRDGNATGVATISTTLSLPGMRSTYRPGAP